MTASVLCFEMLKFWLMLIALAGLALLAWKVIIYRNLTRACAMLFMFMALIVWVILFLQFFPPEPLKEDATVGVLGTGVCSQNQEAC